MKWLALALVAASSMFGLGCASTGGYARVVHVSGSGHESSSETQGSTIGPRTGVMAREIEVREPRGVDAVARGVPTPQPARDPAITPIPQPPLPNIPERPVSSRAARWY